MKKPRNDRRGFSLLMVTMLVALVTISSLVVIDIVTGDQEMLGVERRSREAREAAEGGTMELINDEQMGVQLPDIASPTLEADVVPPADAVFSGYRADGLEMKYEGKVSLIRTSPVMESSHDRVRAVVYEVEVHGHSSYHESIVQTQIYKMASASPGLLRARRHAH